MNAVTHLQKLIRLNTTNPPGNEILAANYLADQLRAVGYAPKILESSPGRGNVITRYKGSGNKRPLLLFNHLDVVPVEPEFWTHDPFGGVIEEGIIWGRGALDMKNVVTQQLMVMIRLMQERPSLHRDVIFAGCADEETDGKMGLDFLVKNHKELIDAEIGLSESGAIPLYMGSHTLYPIQCGEKGNCRLILRVRAAPGHGASPDYTNYSIRFLAIAIERLTRAQLPIHITSTIRNFLEIIKRLLDIDADLMSDAKIESFLEKIPDQEIRHFLVHVTRNSAAPTIIRGGTKINVVPSIVETVLDGRILPGQTCTDLIAEVRAVIGNDLPLEIIHIPSYDSPALETPSEGPIWESLVRNLKKHDPKAEVVPMLLAGGTDAKLLLPLDIKTYGFSPMALPRNFNRQGLVHGHDERIPISALNWGIDVLYDTILDLCS